MQKHLLYTKSYDIVMLFHSYSYPCIQNIKIIIFNKHTSLNLEIIPVGTMFEHNIGCHVYKVYNVQSCINFNLVKHAYGTNTKQTQVTMVIVCIFACGGVGFILWIEWKHVQVRGWGNQYCVRKLCMERSSVSFSWNSVKDKKVELLLSNRRGISKQEWASQSYMTLR